MTFQELRKSCVRIANFYLRVEQNTLNNEEKDFTE